MRTPYLFVVLPLLPLFCSEPAPIKAAETHPFTIQDLVMLDRASELSASPNGRFLAFTLRSTDLEANKGKKDIWIVAASGGTPKRMTAHPAPDWGAQWLSDSTLAFLSTRDGSTQIYTIEVDGGEAVKLSDLPVDAENLRVSPDGRLIGFSAEVYPDCPDLACTAKRDKDASSKKATGKVYDSLFVRRWDTWSNGKRNHVFVMPAKGGNPVDLMKGIDADGPTRPWGGIEEYAFSPDGKTVALTFKAPMGSKEAWSTNEDIWLVPADGSAPPKNVSEDNPARDSQPVFSPDGKSVAWLAMKKPGYEADKNRVVIYDIAAGQKRWLTEEWDRTADTVLFAKDGDKLYVTGYELGQHAIFTVDARSGKVQLLLKDGHNDGVVEIDRGIAFLRDTITSPSEVFTFQGGRDKKLTELNAERMSAVKLGTPEQFSFAGAKGETVYAYIVRPTDFDPAKKYPLAFLVHGGPQGSFGNDWHYRWNPQTYAGAGYGAVMIDFHGSTGYGQGFQDAINGDWGGAPYEDLMKGLDATLARYSWVDGGKVCALGASYGAYMVNYIAGKTDRFKCLVSHDGNLDERMAYFDTEEL